MSIREFSACDGFGMKPGTHIVGKDYLNPKA
jgi:hypothetical protein